MAFGASVHGGLKEPAANSSVPVLSLQAAQGVRRREWSADEGIFPFEGHLRRNNGRLMAGTKSFAQLGAFWKVAPKEVLVKVQVTGT